MPVDIFAQWKPPSFLFALEAINAIKDTFLTIYLIFFRHYNDQRTASILIFIAT